jgi:phosphoribosyl 1,2-cyclic phosphodiesterase
MIKIRFWGTRGSIATPGPATVKYGGNTSCVEVRAEGSILIFDAGTGIRDLGNALLEEFADSPLKLFLFISHTHWDHIQGFPFFLPAYQEQTSIQLYGPPGRDKSLDAILRAQMDSDYFPVSLGDMTANIQVQEMRDDITIGKVHVRPFYLNHPAMTLGYRVTVENRSIVYATDNEPYEYTLHKNPHRAGALSNYGQKLDESFVDFIAGTDLYIAEAQYTKEEYQSKLGWGHSPIESVVDFAVRGKVKRMALFHHDPMHDDVEVDRMIRHAKRLLQTNRARIECFGAHEGQTILLR